MSDTTTAAAAAAAADDERLAYRGVFQRMLIRPEIGAAIGAVTIWIFFWAVSVPFGKGQLTAVETTSPGNVITRLRFSLAQKLAAQVG